MSQRRCDTSLHRDMIRWSAAGADPPWQDGLDCSPPIATRRMTCIRDRGLRCDPAPIFCCRLSPRLRFSPTATAGSTLKSP